MGGYVYVCECVRVCVYMCLYRHMCREGVDVCIGL